mgnify:CR=1 FL=1
MRKEGFTDEEMRLLRESQENSDALVTIETEAMGAAKGGAGATGEAAPADVQALLTASAAYVTAASLDSLRPSSRISARPARAPVSYMSTCGYVW